MHTLKLPIVTAITLLRFLLLAPILLGLFGHIDLSVNWIIGLTILACVSDKLDGSLARYWDCTTEWGARLDELLDKVFSLIILLSLAIYTWPEDGIFSSLLFGIFTLSLIRDSHITWLRKQAGGQLTVANIGKWRTFAQMSLICASMLYALIGVQNAEFMLTVPVLLLAGITATLTFYSWGSYVQAYKNLTA